MGCLKRRVCTFRTVVPPPESKEEVEDEAQETWDLLGQEGVPGSGAWLSSTAPLHLALGWAGSPLAGAGHFTVQSGILDNIWDF